MKPEDGTNDATGVASSSEVAAATATVFDSILTCKPGLRCFAEPGSCQQKPEIKSELQYKRSAGAGQPVSLRSFVGRARTHRRRLSSGGARAEPVWCASCNKARILQQRRDRSEFPQSIASAHTALPPRVPYAVCTVAWSRGGGMPVQGCVHLKAAVLHGRCPRGGLCTFCEVCRILETTSNRKPFYFKRVSSKTFHAFSTKCNKRLAAAAAREARARRGVALPSVPAAAHGPLQCCVQHLALSRLFRKKEGE